MVLVGVAFNAAPDGAVASIAVPLTAEVVAARLRFPLPFTTLNCEPVSVVVVDPVLLAS